MITEIGFVAGDIWQVLEKSGAPVTLRQLCRRIDAPRDSLLMSLGWLAREGHVVMEAVPPVRRGPRDYLISLRERSA